MATGILGKANPAAATDTNLFQVGVGKTVTFNVSACNRTDTDIFIRLSLSTASAAPANDEYIEYDTVLPAYGVLERTGMVLEASKYVIVRASAANVTFMAWGIEA